MSTPPSKPSERFLAEMRRWEAKGDAAPVPALASACAELALCVDEQHARIEALEKQSGRGRNPLNELGEPCAGCGKRSRVTSAGCDHCDYEDK